MANLSTHAAETVALPAPAQRQAGKPQAPLRAAVVGIGGYAGGELARLLLRHPRLASSAPLFLGRPALATTSSDDTLEHLHPQLAGKVSHRVLPFGWDCLRDNGTDVVFFATPHAQSRALVPEALARGLRVIDLSGAWRLTEPQNRVAYAFRDEDGDRVSVVQEQAVYGCPELDKGRIRDARLVANPGCYATSILLGLAPLLRAGVVDVRQEIICDAKSGVSGAGKLPTSTTHFMYAADNFSAYSVFGHRHTGELLEQLSLSPEQIRFTPHLLPIPRGIFSSLHLRLNRPYEPTEIRNIFTSFYRGRPLIRVRPQADLPQIQHVVHTNCCDLGFALDRDGSRLFVASCLDNLLKGAAGQAVQNMNVMSGWNEAEGLL